MVNIKSGSDNCISKCRPMHSADKLTTLLQQSQSRHINRIRFGIEKRKRKESGQFSYGQPEKPNNRLSKVRTKNLTYPSFPNKKELIQSRLGDDIETKRFLTSDANNLLYRSSEHSGDKGDGFDHTTTIQGPTQVTPTSNKTSSDCTKKSRKQWVKTIQPVLNATAPGEDNTSDRNGYGYLKKSYSMRNNWEFNNTQNERNVQSLEYVFKKTPIRLPATEKMANVAQWLEGLPLPESGEPILEPVPYGIFEEREEFHQSPGENIITKHDDLAKNFMGIGKEVEDHQSSGENIITKHDHCGKDLISIGKDVEDHQSSCENIITKQDDSAKHLMSIGGHAEDIKNAEKSQGEIVKQMVTAFDLAETRQKEYQDRKEIKKILSKKAKSLNRVGLKTKTDYPLKVAYTPSGKLKVIICLKSLKEKNLAGRTLLIWLSNFQHSVSNVEKNGTTSRKLEKGFSYLNDQEIKFFENIFKNKDTNGNDKCE